MVLRLASGYPLRVTDPSAGINLLVHIHRPGTSLEAAPADWPRPIHREQEEAASDVANVAGISAVWEGFSHRLTCH